MLIAASRHDWNMPTPDVFADEADWFAARILLLNVRFVHLHTSLAPMLQLANSRARAFAERNRLPFTAAKIRPSLHNKRPAHVLLMACDLPAAQEHLRQHVMTAWKNRMAEPGERGRIHEQLFSHCNIPDGEELF